MYPVHTFLLQVCIRYILFASSMYRYVLSTYLSNFVHILVKNYVLVTYFSSHVTVCTSTYQYMSLHDLFSLSGTAFLSFLNGTSVYILTSSSSQYVLGVRDYIALLPGPAVCLPAIQAAAHTLNQITLEGLFTTAWHHPLCHGFLPLARGGLAAVQPRLQRPQAPPPPAPSGRLQWPPPPAPQLLHRLDPTSSLRNSSLRQYTVHRAFEALGLGTSAGTGHRQNLLVVLRQGV